MNYSFKKTRVATINSQIVYEYQIVSENGFTINFLNYGGIITAIYAPDKYGNFANVVLREAKFDPSNPGYLGAITGRVAGRIANGHFILDGYSYQLAQNNGKHNLHGGLAGLDKQIWEVTQLANRAKLTYHSADMENGFPGNIGFEIVYEITAANQLTITARAYPDKNTIINLTNHSYFDLSCGVSPLNQQLKIPADFYGEIDKSGIVNGKVSHVANTPFDFREFKQIGRDIFSHDTQIQLAGGYDHPYILKANQPIELKDPHSGRYLTVNTSEPVCVIYSANFHTPKHSGICLETQRFPNAINLPEFRDTVIFGPEKPYESINIWQFGANRE